MKIIKNTSGRSTREIKKVFTKVHAYMRKLENRAAPNWKNLRVKIEGRDGNYHSGRAYYNGHGDDWDLFLTLPRPIVKGQGFNGYEHAKGRANKYRVHELVHIVYHELMHTYGYDHSQYSDITTAEAEKLYPENFEVPVEQPTPAKLKQAACPKWRTKYESALKRRKAWLSKQKRAANALKKVEKQIKYYERTYQKEL